MEQGSLYPALHRLEEQGWISSQWGVSDNNRKANFYKLTPSGRKQLIDERSRLTRNLIAALFTHDTSRLLDPHLHTHCIVFNATHDPEERRWKALQNQEMLKARKYGEAVYYHELAKDLRRFGYRIRNRARGDFELEGVSDEVCERFSKRHQQIDDA